MARSAPVASLVLALVLGLAGSALGCRRGPDPLLASPQATLDTLMAAYGVTAMPEAEVRRDLRAHRHFALRDRKAFRACFADFRLPSDEGLAGFVFGSLIASKDHLRIVRNGSKALVFRGAASDGALPAAVLRRTDDGWKIGLRDSVPERLALQLREVYRRAEERTRRHGGPS